VPSLVVNGGPSQGYRPRGSQDGGPAFDNDSPLRWHNDPRSTIAEYDLRADTAAMAGQPVHEGQRKARCGDVHHRRACSTCDKRA
jgi:hypothetical protein